MRAFLAAPEAWPAGISQSRSDRAIPIPAPPPGSSHVWPARTATDLRARAQLAAAFEDDQQHQFIARPRGRLPLPRNRCRRKYS